MSKRTFITNTLILLITSFIIRILGLANRILLTRLLGPEGIGLYILCIPTIILFVSFTGFSLYTAVTRVVATNEVTQKYTHKQILTAALFIAAIVSLIGIIILLLILNPLATKWLKQPNTFYPLLMSVFFLPLVAVNNCLRGFYNGLKKINISAFANLIEQIFRIIASVLFLVMFSKYGIVLSVALSILSMSIGEAFSLIYVVVLLKKYLKKKPKTNIDPQKDILAISIPATSSKMVGSFTYFLEPIIYTLALTMLGMNAADVSFYYSEFSAYAESLLTMFIFISTSIAVAIVPHISEAMARKNKRLVSLYIKKTLLASLLPGILFTIILFFYAPEFMHLFYKTNIGSDLVKKFAIVYLSSYIINPLVAIMNSVGRAKETFFISTTFNIVKLALIFSLAFIPSITTQSLIIACASHLVIISFIIYLRLKKLFDFSFKLNEKINLIIITSLSIVVTIFLKSVLGWHYLLVCSILGGLFALNLFILKVFHFDYE